MASTVKLIEDGDEREEMASPGRCIREYAGHQDLSCLERNGRMLTLSGQTANDSSSFARHDGDGVIGTIISL